MDRLSERTATAILGIDTLWGGDVMNPSGTGRFIADSWFSDQPLPAAYTHPAAAAVRAAGGVGAKQPDRAAVKAYLGVVDVKGAIKGMAEEARSVGGLRAAYLDGLAVAVRTGRTAEADGGDEPSESVQSARRLR